MSTSKQSSSPPEGYKTFLVNAAKREKAEQEWMTRVLCEALNMPDANLVELATIGRAAQLALVGLAHGGFELSLDEAGELKWVTT